MLIYIILYIHTHTYMHIQGISEIDEQTLRVYSIHYKDKKVI